MANSNPDQSGLAQNNPKLYRRPKKPKETKAERIKREAKEEVDKALKDPRKYVDEYIITAAESGDDSRRKKGMMLIKWLELKTKESSSSDNPLLGDE